MKKKKVSFVGFGQMAGAILSGIIKNGIVSSVDVGIFDINKEKLSKYKDSGYSVFESIEELIKGSEMAIIAVRPQDFANVLPLIKKEISSDIVLVSIAAGITSEYLQKELDFPAKAVLAMPNTPLLFGKGATGLARTQQVSEAEFARAKEIFGVAGVVEEVEPYQLNTIIPISGSGPAFIYKYAEVVMGYATAQGISEKKAMNLFAQTLVGSAEMLLNSGKSPAELIEMVCTPEGATIEGMKALEKNGFDKALNAALEACVKRAEELSRLND